MTPTRLDELGYLLFGPHWQSPLARALGVGPRHVRKWAAGTTPIPADRADQIIALIRARARALGEAAKAG